jgi:hypothetical protein
VAHGLSSLVEKNPFFDDLHLQTTPRLENPLWVEHPNPPIFKFCSTITRAQTVYHTRAERGACMPEITPLLTLETIAAYLKKRDVNLEIESQNNQRFIRMNWKFEMGDAAVVISLSDGPSNTSRLEVTCVTHNQYRARRAQVMELLNTRNRERAFARSIDADGNVWLEYVGFYPTAMPLPEDTFETIFGGVLVHFQDDYATLEGVTPAAQA